MGLFAPKNSAPRPIWYSGLNVGSSQLDLPVPLFWGQRRLATNAIWYGDFQKHAVSPKGKGGGKGGQEYDYTAAVIMAMCEGQVDSIARIFAQGSTTSTSTLAALNFTFFNGTALQSPWSFVTTKYPTQARAYANIAYVACPKLDLGMSATIPDNQFECVRANGFAYTHTSQGWIDGSTHIQYTAIDVLLSDVIPDFLTNVRYGMGLTLGDLDATSLAQFAAYQQAQGLFFSPLLNSQEKATDILDRWATISNSWIFWNGIKIQFVPLGDSALSANGATYTPNLNVIANLSVQNLDFLGDTPISVERKDPADCYNRTRLDINDRTIGYVTNPLEYKDQTLVDQYGLRDSSSTQADECCDPLVGKIIVQLVGKRNAYLRNTYSWKSPYKWVLLLPGDIVTLTEPNIGLNQLRVRITEVSENDNDELEFKAEEFPGNLGTYYSTSPSLANAGSTPNLYELPSAINTPAVLEPNSSFTGGQAVLVIAASGATHWGGCTVNISFDGTDYTEIGKITSPAIQGLLTANLANHADPDNTNTLSVDCTESLMAVPATITHADADALRTLCLVNAQPTVIAGPISVLANNGELLAPGADASTGTYSSNLTYLRRGKYGTAPASHSTGDQFTMVDVLGVSGTALRFNLPAQYIGQTIYLKFCSFNEFGNLTQDISTVIEYQYTPLGTGYGGGTSGVPTTPTGLTATPGIQQVALAWNANPTTDNVTGYQVWRAAGTGASFGSAALLQTVNALGWVDTTVAPNTGYTYFLVAVNAAGTSAATAGVNATTPTTTIGIAGGSFSYTDISTKPLNQVICGFAAIYPWTFPSTAHGGFIEGWVDTPPTSNTDFDLRQNGVSVGTARWTTGSNTPTLIKASDTAFVLGGRFDVATPASLNGMAGNWRLSVAGTR
jgi:hypothetical protein